MSDILTDDDHLERLEAMAGDSGVTWDFSENDRATLEWAVMMAQEAMHAATWNKLGTVQAFLACADNVKAEFFRSSLRDSTLLKQARAALDVTAGNIRSLGPAGALNGTPMEYREWLALVEAAIGRKVEHSGSPEV